MSLYAGDNVPRAVLRASSGLLGVTYVAFDGSWLQRDSLAWPSSSFTFAEPAGLAATEAGLLYVADAQRHRLYRVEASGVLSTFAGTEQQGHADGLPGRAMFSAPHGLVWVPNRGLYVADRDNHCLRLIKTGAGSEEVSTFVGSPGTSGSQDGKGRAALFDKPHGVAADTAGNLYVTDTNNKRVCRVTPDGTVTTISKVDQFEVPVGIAVEPDGSKVYVADRNTHCIHVLTRVP
ncbi:MAG: SMP-30/gluconolactonase/LRE family protein [Candidatus Sericytochromatia bacterium]|nr:SMP-30/gluconolactonase/LRE family protein [Candidatus Sericytochromatia bacterium]